ncbi:MAG TPA: 3-oxoacyl-[acyl-carrier-protein] synthase III C-terminal domain-containing protein [Pyrinomonadaceae bacterium]|jgi:3-oxoacyl-[acyl-carrier-protein] synthase III|nr:3-oxoacyl-[acyl-carrier-protein] synthase III C-terminal domain-containing protein [Pyrinomonadaceae bacterium]
MRIAAVHCLLPENEIGNDEVLDLACYYSRGKFPGSLDDLRNSIRQSLVATGIRTRFWRGKGVRPLDLIADSYRAIVGQAGISPKDVDILIYVGIDRGFVEPANACFVASKLGLRQTRAFDIVDACMGWCTALQVSQALIAKGDAHNVLVVSSECPMDLGGTILPRSFTIGDIDELRWKFPAFTLGEAVSITLLSTSENSFRFHVSSDSSKADLCTIPLYKFGEYSDPSVKLEGKQQFDFSAYGFNLFASGYSDCIAVCQQALRELVKLPQLIFPHSVSSTAVNKVSKQLGVDGRIFSTFEHTGNIATSSVPANIHFALRSGKLKSGDYCLAWISSSGLKHAAFDIYL